MIKLLSGVWRLALEVPRVILYIEEYIINNVFNLNLKGTSKIEVILSIKVSEPSLKFLKSLIRKNRKEFQDCPLHQKLQRRIILKLLAILSYET